MYGFSSLYFNEDCTTTAQNDSTITGVNSTMEYRLSIDSAWTSISESMVTGLQNGTYYVRVKTTGTVLASPSVAVTIEEHVCTAQGGWKFDGSKHWKECQCGARLYEGAHEGGTATCTKKAVCKICGSEYGELNASNHNYGEPEWSWSEDGLSFTSNAAYKHFQKVQVDGKDLNASNYTVKEGSTIVTLKASYLKTLSVGKHTLSIVSDTGTATTEFTIKAADSANDQKPANPNDTAKGEATESVQTGDNTNMMLWIVMLFVSVSILGITVYGKQKKHMGN